MRNALLSLKVLKYAQNHVMKSTFFTSLWLAMNGFSYGIFKNYRVNHLRT